MFAGRDNEIKFLEKYYNSEGSSILVLYGVRGIGKTRLLKEFAKDKTYTYYAAGACSAAEQISEWSAEIEETESGMEARRFPINNYTEIFERLLPDTQGKKLLVLDEFQNLVKGSKDFFGELTAFVANRKLSRPVMAVLLSSANGWIENSMVKSIGSLASYIDDFYKVKELTYQQMRKIFPEFANEDALKLYMALGGIPGLWQSLDRTLGFKENVIKNILCRESRLYEEMSVYLNEDLREPAVYNTILVTIASGKGKLNDIYEKTGYSRAKISVYLKNLMELDLVEKIYSGQYRISNSYVKFYYRFLFPNRSMLEMLSAEEFYDRKISSSFDGAVVEDYGKICRQVLASQLPEGMNVEQWRDKDGYIDIISVDDNANRIVGRCIYDREADIHDYEQLMKAAKRAGILVDRALIYSEKGYTKELQSLAADGRTELRGILTSDMTTEKKVI
jgi:AAA+ ATPase superfamily predicted ATPase